MLAPRRKFRQKRENRLKAATHSHAERNWVAIPNGPFKLPDRLEFFAKIMIGGQILSFALAGQGAEVADLD